MTGALHIVGAGMAGLAAARAALHRFASITVHEAAPQPGGRCGALRDAAGGPGIDRGTHVLVGASRRALAFIDAVGAAGRWLEPEPDGLPIADLEVGSARRVGLAPAAWWRAERRPPGWSPAAALGLARLVLAPGRHTVAELCPDGALLRGLIEPLTLAALNTPPAEASAARLAAVLRRLLRPGAGRLLVARDGLGRDLVAPAVRHLNAHGVEVACGRRIRGITIEGGRVVALRHGHGTVTLGPADSLLLALPPRALATLLPGSRLPAAFEAIVNLHWEVGYAGPVRFIGVLGGAAQWLLLRPGLLSVTISAARAWAEMPDEALATRIRAEAERALALAGIAPAPREPHRPPLMVPAASGPLMVPAAPAPLIIKERQATPRQGPGDLVAMPDLPATNLALAGDWLGPLPATIEAAVRAGEAAVARLERVATGSARFRGGAPGSLRDRARIAAPAAPAGRSSRR